MKRLEEKAYRAFYLIIGTLILSLIGSTSCDPSFFEDEECESQPSSCVTDKPGSGPLIISLTINSKNPSVPVKIFRGDFDNGDLLLDTVVTGSGFSYILPIDQYYSVVADYIQKDGDTVIAIDGDDIEVDENDYCEGPCFEMDPGRIDVKLHFPKTSGEPETRTRYRLRPLHVP